MDIMSKDKNIYSVVAVLWNDPHIVLRSELPGDDLYSIVTPTLTVGVLYQKTKDYVVLLHTVERSHIDKADFTVIFSGCIISIKKFGKIELTDLRPEGAS